MVGNWVELNSKILKSTSNKLGNFKLRITCLSSHWLVQYLTWENDRIWFSFLQLSESYSLFGNRAFKPMYLVHMGLSKRLFSDVLVLDRANCSQFQNRPMTVQCWIFKRPLWHLCDNIYILNCKKLCATAMREEWGKNARGTALQTPRSVARKGRRCCKCQRRDSLAAQVPKERFPCSPKTKHVKADCDSGAHRGPIWSRYPHCRNLILKQLDAPQWKVQPMKSPVRNRFLTELSPVESSLYRTRCSGSCGPWGTHAEEVCIWRTMPCGKDHAAAVLEELCLPWELLGMTVV